MSFGSVFTMSSAIRDIPNERRGAAMGIYQAVYGAGMFLGPVIAGRVIDGFSIAGADLAPDPTKEDEYVAFANAQGVETKAEITFADLQNVKAHLAAALEPGDYTLKVYTRSGLGERFGVHVAKRKVTVA